MSKNDVYLDKKYSQFDIEKKLYTQHIFNLSDKQLIFLNKCGFNIKNIVQKIKKL